jgi:hypothetical protein
MALNIVCFITTAASGSAAGLPTILLLLLGMGWIGVKELRKKP